MTDNSDYSRPRTKLNELLPGNLRSETTNVLFENLFNRFLTKNETSRVAGYIGDGNPEAIVQRQIHEPTVHRQAFQLQPVLNAKIGSVEHMASWQDLINELERLGVDVTRLPIWGKILQFNWVPPVDLDKLVNFQDYYWYDETNANSRPEYITIRNRCTAATAYANFWQRLIDEYDSTQAGIPIDQILQKDGGSPNEYNKFVFLGEYARLFEPGFQMYVRDSSNAQLNRQIFEVVSVEYEDLTNITTVTIDSTLTDNTIGGAIVSLAEQLSVAVVTRECYCSGSIGWDTFQWDDNPRNPLWETADVNATYPDHEAWLAGVSNAGPPVGTPTTNEVWYDTVADILYEYNVANAVWVSVVQNFSATLNNTFGTSLWDAGECGTGAALTSALQWVNTNKWVHKTDVPNLTTAKRALFPIIEYNADLEINEWSVINHIWRYRSGESAGWEDSSTVPGLIELGPIRYYDEHPSYPNTIILDARYGDQTNWFTPGRQFRTDTGNPDVFTVEQSFLASSLSGGNLSTVVVLAPTNSPNVSLGSPYPDLVPLRTSHGDLWAGYDVHWVYTGTTDPVPVNHQVENPLVTIDLTTDVSAGTYQYRYGYYAQTNTTSGATTDFQLFYRSPTQVNYGLSQALIGFDDLRVYLDKNITTDNEGLVRQYGTYEELTEVDLGIGVDTTYVAGIRFFDPIAVGQTIRIEVGPAALSDLGLSDIEVRTSETNAATKTSVSLIRYRKIEQVKSAINQYPLFDLYRVDGTSANIASPIFTYQTSPSATLQPALGVRLVQDTTIRNYGFVQYLISEDNGTLYAYRDYANVPTNYWYNDVTSQVKIWDSLGWKDRTDVVYQAGTAYISPTISSEMPSYLDLVGGLVGHVWVDPVTGITRRRITSTGNDIDTDWIIFSSVSTAGYDESLQTIWKKGLYDEEYVPAKVDWLKRTEAEYNEAQALFEQERIDELVIGGVSTIDAQAQATAEWYEKQANEHSPTGVWVGDWEIPDPLYFNNLHENRQIVTYRELLTHFNTIINAQPKIPGYAGPRTSMFHMIPPEDVNYGLGGKIKEFNDGFDTFLSSIFVNNVSPLRLVEFARDQYDNLLNALRETYRRQLITLLTDTSDQSLADLSGYIADTIVTEYEQSDNTALVYGDSTTFTEVNGVNDLGMRNWITTLPYFRLSQSTSPTYLVDDTQGINQILHHDGHLDQYTLPTSTIETVSRALALVPDPRVSDTFGRVSSLLPPSTSAAFTSSFATTIEGREGVYWFYVPPAGDRVLYRLTIASAGPAEPADASVDGTLWYDTGTDTLRIKAGTNWNVVSGLTVGDGLLDNGAGVSAWQEVDFNAILNGIIIEVESKLYQNVPEYKNIPYDLEAVAAINPALHAQYMEEEFLTYALEQGIVAPYRNSNFVTTDVWTWNYKNSVIAQYPSPSNLGTESGGDWRDLYTKLYGTAYPHLEPWKLQGYTSKPTWWDTEYADTTGTRRWTPAMWTNIFAGNIVAGRQYPNGITSVNGDPSVDRATSLLQVPDLPTWSYVSVNIATSGSPEAIVADGITVGPDELLPPYSSYNDTLGTRSVFTLNGQIISESADYAFGDAGPVEWDWASSSNYRYALMSAAFRLDPVRFVCHTFGKSFYEVGGLQIDVDTENTFSHTRTNFHGEVVGTQPYLINGTNQWYVNFNRYSGFDTSYSNFRPLWTGWTAPLTYQLSSFIDTESFILGHRTVDVTSFDWRITSKKSPGTDDSWYDAFKIALLEIPPSTARYDNEAQWVFELNTNLPVSRTIKYYDIKNYQFSVDATTDVCSIYTYPIVAIDTTNNRVGISGDQTLFATEGRTFTITGSTGNNGTYTIISSSFDVVTNATYIVVDNVTNATVDGTVMINYRDLPWETGDRIYLTTQETLPSPLLSDTEYFVIVLNDREFKLARTSADALAGTAIDLTTTGRRNHFVGQVNSTFYAFDGNRSSTAWKHYEVDRSTLLSLTLPAEVSGIQTIINIVDGYEAYGYDQGWRVNESGALKDPATGRNAGWQVEVERFIDYIFGIRTQRNKPISTKYEITADTTTDSFTFVDQYAQFLTGDPVMFFSDNTVLPPPLIARIKYYVIRDSLNTFRIAGSKYDANNNIPVDFSASPGSPTWDRLYVMPAPTTRTVITTVELNPFRNGIWYRPEFGIVSNVLTGPSEDLRSSQLVFDQYGRPIGKNNIRVMREDKQTHLAVPDQIFNDVELSNVFNDPYNYLHLGGAHLFVDTYEHVLIFNNYTSENQLLYDPFVGLNVTKYELQFRRQEEFTQRPNVGGYYLNTFYNQNVGLNRNIEASIEDLRYLYDTYVVPETETLILNSRKALGYDGTRDYMDNLNVGPKSQFVFWRGMIQQKGSINAIKAFINSRRFLDAKVDEFWAVKLADFGAAGDKEYPELFLTAEDARANDIRFEFVIDDDLCLPGYAVNVFDKDPCGYAYPEDGEGVLIGSDGFTPISLTDETRWNNQPDQLETLRNNGNTLYFTMKPVTDVRCSYGTSYPASPFNNQGFVLFNGTTYEFHRWNASTLTWDAHGLWDPNTIEVLPTLRHGMKADAIELTVDVNMIVEGTPLPPVEPKQQLLASQTGNDITLPFAYIPFASALKVFKHQRATVINITTAKPGSPSARGTRSILTLAGDYTTSLVPGQEITLINEDAGGSPTFVPFVRIPSAVVKIYTPDNIEGAGSPDAEYNPPIRGHGSPIAYTTVVLEDAIIDTMTGSPISFSPATFDPNTYKYASFGRMLISGTDYAEVLGSGGALMSTQIQVPVPLTLEDRVTVAVTTAVLTEGIHYNIVNADIIEFIFSELYTGTTVAVGSPARSYTLSDLRIWGFMQDDSAQDPAKLIDIRSNTVVTSIPMWDPARGIHYHQAAHNLDLLNTLDPARYNNTPLITQSIEPGDGFTRVVPNIWTKEQVGTTWLDTRLLHYIRYFDGNAITDLDLRLGYWGRKADWATTTAYEWVESDVHPENWNDIASLEENDGTLPEETRKAGRVYPRLFKTNILGQWERSIPTVREYDISIEGEPVYSGSPQELVSYDVTIGRIGDNSGIVLPAGEVIGGNPSLKTFEMVGDYTALFFVDDKIFYTDNINLQYSAPTINTEFTIADIVYDSLTNITTITVNEPVTVQFSGQVIQTVTDTTIEVDSTILPYISVGSQLTISGMEDALNNSSFIVTDLGVVPPPPTFSGTVIRSAWGGTCYPGLTNNAIGYAGARTLLNPAYGTVNDCSVISTNYFKASGIPAAITNATLDDGRVINAMYQFYLTGGPPWYQIVLEIYSPSGVDPGENYFQSITIGTTTYSVGSGATWVDSQWFPTMPTAPYTSTVANIRRWRWTTTEVCVFCSLPNYTITFPAYALVDPETVLTVVRVDGDSPALSAPDCGASGYWSLTKVPTIVSGGRDYAVGDIIELRPTHGTPVTYGDPVLAYAHSQVRVTRVGTSSAVIGMSTSSTVIETITSSSVIETITDSTITDDGGSPPLLISESTGTGTGTSTGTGTETSTGTSTGTIVETITGIIEEVEIYVPGNYPATFNNLDNEPYGPILSVSRLGGGTGATFSVEEIDDTGSPQQGNYTISPSTRGTVSVTLQPSYNGIIKSQETDAFAVSAYANGLVVPSSLSIVSYGSPTVHEYVLTFAADDVKRADHITVVQPVPSGDRLERGIGSGALSEQYEYTTTTYVDSFGVEQTKYFFWVEDKTTKRSYRTLSPAESERQIVSIPSPYIFFQKVRRPTVVFVDGYPITLPLRMSQSIIRGLRGIVNDDRRYVLRYTRDYTLRDSLDKGSSKLQLKNKHTEWELIREEQPSKIRRALWDKVTESIIGVKLDGTTRVPSLSRELYDTKYEADTQYGLGRDQAFANGTLAIAAVLAYLIDEENDFRPIDINVFFQDYSFDTPENIVAAMDRIYTAFAAIHVNKIFFSVLHDAAFSKKQKYAEIFKTSMIALHGVKPFQVGGLFDD